MNAAKKGLGRGLSALFGDIEKKSGSNQNQTNKVPIADLQRNKYQPRTIFNEEKIMELSSSIKENGVIQPIAVRPNNYEPGKYEIVAGERRWLAAQKAGLNEVPVIILEIDDQKSLEIAIVENVQRQDLNVIEEAKGYQRLIKEFGYDHEKISKFMSKSRSHISNTLRLLTLPQDILSMIEEGELTAGQARPLIGLPNASDIAENIVRKKISAREVESLTKMKKAPKKSKIEDPNITFIKNEIESKLGLNVEILNKKNNSGKITIKYKSLDQFELISKKLTK
ncbi:MAG: ParB/RepB/Spo0J family partition protein [Pelagibacteraceae bacterium TMED124]|nr:MAG: ParB/RepB/Spo0J family partition protein [Pelagibacteraceae bacterium TMED124]|tara:strand:+ start:206 stop:1051 length:846 start_codon:yes stop_codon:yes gene_type:complete